MVVSAIVVGNARNFILRRKFAPIYCEINFKGPVMQIHDDWRHQMETFSALLALYEMNPPVAGRFLSQRPVTRGFDVSFDLRLNKRLRKQSRRRWFETPSRSLWRHCNALIKQVCICCTCRITQHYERSWFAVLVMVPTWGLSQTCALRQAGGRLNKKDGLTRYGDSHVKDKTS